MSSLFFFKVSCSADREALFQVRTQRGMKKDLTKKEAKARAGQRWQARWRGPQASGLPRDISVRMSMRLSRPER